MPACNYDEIFGSSLLKKTDVTILGLDNGDYFQMQTIRLHSALSNPRIRRVFKEIEYDDEIQILTFELNDKTNDELSDKEFAIELLALAMKIEWYQATVDDVINMGAVIGGKEEKAILNNYKVNIQRLNELKTELAKMIRDRGYMYNAYLSGEVW